MVQNNSIVAVFGHHLDAEVSIKQLMHAGIALENLTVVGKSRQAEEKMAGFYDMGDGPVFWGRRGAFWGSLWRLLPGGVCLALPVVGDIMVLGYLAATVISAVEGGIMAGGLSALSAALYSAGIPKGSVIEYEQAVRANGLLVIAHGSPQELANANVILAAANPSRLQLHDGSAILLSPLALAELSAVGQDGRLISPG